MGNSDRVRADENWLLNQPEEAFLESGTHFTLRNRGLAPLFRINEALLETGNERERVQRCMSAAKRFLLCTSAADIFAELFSDASASAALSLVSHLVHVGVIVPHALSRELPAAGALAGFRLNPTIFPSVAVARELGALIGRSAVQTTIFKVFAEGLDDDGLISFEAFIPSGIEDSTVTDWMTDNVGTHFALRVDHLAQMNQLKDLFEREGYSMPAFMNGQPMTNAAENATIMYFDGMHSGRHLRIECYCPSV
jgi:hypothetical protein